MVIKEFRQIFRIPDGPGDLRRAVIQLLVFGYAVSTDIADTRPSRRPRSPPASRVVDADGVRPSIVGARSSGDW
jgi:hypothetical protein